MPSVYHSARTETTSLQMALEIQENSDAREINVVIDAYNTCDRNKRLWGLFHSLEKKNSQRRCAQPQ